MYPQRNIPELFLSDFHADYVERRVFFAEKKE